MYVEHNQIVKTAPRRTPNVFTNGVDISRFCLVHLELSGTSRRHEKSGKTQMADFADSSKDLVI